MTVGPFIVDSIFFDSALRGMSSTCGGVGSEGNTAADESAPWAEARLLDLNLLGPGRASSVACRLPFPDKGSSSIIVTAQTWRRKAPARLSSMADIELRPGEKKRLKSEPWWLWSTSNMLEAVMVVVVTGYNETIIGGRRSEGVSTSSSTRRIVQKMQYNPRKGQLKHHPIVSTRE